MISLESSQVKFEAGFEVVEGAVLDVDLERPHFFISRRGCCRPLSFAEPFLFEDRGVGWKREPIISLQILILLIYIQWMYTRIMSLIRNTHFNKTVHHTH